MHLGNPNLRGHHETVDYEQWQVDEYRKCAADFFYFAENYAYIVSNRKKKPAVLREYQKDLINFIHNDRFIIAKWPRQSGKSTCLSVYIAWLTVFNENHNTLIAAHVHKTAIEICGKVKEVIENLPLWLQEGVVKWNELLIEFENGSRVISSATTKDAGRGFSYSFVLLDEFAFVEPAVAKEFYTSIYPTLATLDDGRMAIISTPNGINHFHEHCEKAELKKSRFKYSEIKWSDIPGRDEKFREETISDIGLDRWMQEFEAIFMGSEGSLISPSVLNRIKTIDPISESEDRALKIYKHPEKGHNYMITVDTSRGKGIDNSAFVVFDITQYTIEVCAIYSDPNVNSVLYPSFINRVGRMYNNASVLVEINDNGQQVADILFDDYEYENLLGCLVTKGRMGQQLTTFGMRSKGIKTSESTKRIGCANLRSLIETSKIEINSHPIKAELSNFIKHNNSFAAQKGMHDDLVMCLVIFGWVTQQKYFQEYIQKGVKDVYADQLAEIEYQMLPIGFVDDGSAQYVDLDDDGMIF